MQSKGERSGEQPVSAAERRRPSEGSYTRRVFIGKSAGVALGVGGIGSFLAACGGGGGSSGKGKGSGEVVVMSWTVYLTPEIQKNFQETTGIKLRAIPAPDDQTMFTKVKAGGGSQYDLVFANAGWTPIYHKNGLTEVIDLDEIPSSKDLWPVFKTDTSFPYIVEPNKSLIYPNMWSATAMMWNTTAPWQPAKPFSWNDLWDAPSGKVILHGAPEDFIAMAGLAQGVPSDQIYSMNGDTLDKAANYLKQLKPFQISPNSDAVTASSIASNKAYIGFVSSLGIAYKANTQYSHGKNVSRAVVPKEGTLGWVDGPQLIKDAKNRDNAMKFLDFWGGNAKNQKYLWDQYFFAQTSKKSTERTVDAGGKSAAIAKSIGADNPDLAKELTWLAPPDDPSAWTSAYDSVVS
jgi:spermidine/putrescine transport system substrate-binding protein